MTHPRTAIRAAVVSLLKFGGTAAGQRVYNSKTQIHESGDLPNISVFTDNDAKKEWRSLGYSYHRQTLLRIECRVSHNSESSAASNLDALCREVELLLDGDRDLNATALLSELGDTEISWNDESDPPVLLAEIEWFAEYVDEMTA